MATEHAVLAPDGTRIAYARSGAGPAVVLVHGAIGDRTSFRAVEPILAARHTVIAVVRRGRVGSGDSAGAYAIEQEFDDLAAVVDSLGEPVAVVGHSFGATVALGAALRTVNVRRLVLYEPSPGIRVVDPALVARLDDLLAAGDRETLLAVALAELAEFGPEDIEAYRRSPLWAPRVVAAHTIPRELRAEEAYAPDPAALAALAAPVLYLRGSESPGWARRGAATIRSMVPGSRVAVLDGQGHMATVTAPQLLVDEIERFLRESGMSRV
jgi:pimeloyl-ACP methyl ester carboxylesterase